jgi:cytosine/adenosine deaminase-related metal-dependent hydrolase
MDTLIKGGLVYTVATRPIKNGAIAIDKGLVVAAGPAADFNGGDFDETINLDGHVITPGFVNAHSHLQFSSLRGKIPPGLGFVEWVRRIIQTHLITPEEEVFNAMRDGVSEMLSTGTTSVGDISSGVNHAKIVAESGLNALCFAEVIAPKSGDAENAFAHARARVDEMLGLGIVPGLSPHAPYTVPENLFRRLHAYAAENRIPTTVHLAESAEEDDYIRAGSGPLRALMEDRGNPQDSFRGFQKSPVRLLESYGALGGTLAVHLNTIDDGDFEALALNRAVPIFCPGSSAWFGRKKVMPLDKFFAAGFRPALGTDSLASNSSLSMLDELRAAEAYFPSINREDLMACATLNGAAVLGLNCGSIEKGKRADIISFVGSETGDALASVFGAKKPDFVMINGKRVI